MNREKLAFAAGLYEGEGSISLHKANNGFLYPRLHINMTDADPLYLFRDAVETGKVQGPYGPYGSTAWKPYFRYRTEGWKSAQLVVAKLWFWLSAHRRSQIHIAFEAFRRSYE